MIETLRARCYAMYQVVRRCDIYWRLYNGLLQLARNNFVQWPAVNWWFQKIVCQPQVSPFVFYRRSDTADCRQPVRIVLTCEVHITRLFKMLPLKPIRLHQLKTYVSARQGRVPFGALHEHPLGLANEWNERSFMIMNTSLQWRQHFWDDGNTDGYKVE